MRWLGRPETMAGDGPDGIPVTAAERHGMPHYEVPEDVDPVALLLAEREEDDR
ncbi:hypothetical protein ACF09K_29610 [Streptomyces sp. NPDC014882]|uniref:hypothetical protein n=1 Tax=Streptomyces sp. NPDC014882 TaxID=3364927 RepID=UPI0036F6AA73